VILDLSCLDTIEIDEMTDTALVEPGVTQQALYEFLAANSLPYMVPTTGAGPTASLLGNALERGYGLTPITDHFAAVRSVTAILGDGTLYQSPLEQLGGAQHAWGLGPYFDGVFSQSNLGIVVALRIELKRRPDTTTAFRIRSEQIEQLVSTTKAIYTKLPGVVTALQIQNAQRMLALRADYPSTESIVPAKVLERLRLSLGVSPWTAVGVVAGERAVVSAAKRVIQREAGLSGLKADFVSERRVAFLNRIRRILPKSLSNQIDLADHFLANAKGLPGTFAHRLIEWRPGSESCRGRGTPTGTTNGLYWYAPLLRFDPCEAATFARFVDESCAKFRTNALITMSCLSMQAIDSTIPILFDREDERAVEWAAQFYDYLFTTGMAEGFIPYRLAITHMDKLTGDELPSFRLAEAIRSTVDPNRVISPGRYG
jgi:FAD/FMN-containing dehydrogenase